MLSIWTTGACKGTTDPATERAAADDCSGDGFEFQTFAAGGSDSGKLGDRNDAGKSGQCGADHKRPNLCPADRNTGRLSGAQITADCIEMSAEASA
jgi:hypothetical protein